MSLEGKRNLLLKQQRVLFEKVELFIPSLKIDLKRISYVQKGRFI